MMLPSPRRIIILAAGLHREVLPLPMDGRRWPGVARVEPTRVMNERLSWRSKPWETFFAPSIAGYPAPYSYMMKLDAWGCRGFALPAHLAQRQIPGLEQFVEQLSALSGDPDLARLDSSAAKLSSLRFELASE